ncbi:MAG: leucyl aminopeptidase [Fidelibacterota bacterium]
MARIKKLIHEDITIKDLSSELLCVGYNSNGTAQNSFSEINHRLNQKLSEIIELEKFEGKFGKNLLVYGDSNLKRTAIYGLGKSEEYTSQSARNLGAMIIKKANSLKVSSISIESTSFRLDSEDKLQAFCEGLILGSYEFNEYKSEIKNANTVEEIVFLNCNKPEILDKTKKLIDGVMLARDVSNHPPNFATPAYLAEQAGLLNQYSNMSVDVIDESKFEEMGLGAFYGVARGSHRPAKLIVIQYKNGGQENPFALVGKGLTFDSGGISLKPGAKMDEMKFDMCGSATVLGVMKAVGELQPNINLVAAIGATENMPGGNAQLPGDIVKAYNGKTIEILNTDAEGRLVLADVLAYVVDQFKPTAILDFATLTGAVLIALGHRATGIMGNDSKLVDEVKKASELTGEKVWELPLWEEYSKDIKSTIADIKNLGAERMAGTIAGGVFLKEFVDKTPWVHMDIAGTAWGVKEPVYQPAAGATGVAVRLVYQLLENRSK